MDRQTLDARHRDRARHIAATLERYGDAMQAAYEAEHWGNPLAARAHRSAANRILLDAEPPVLIPGLCVAPGTAETV